jgi:hypothetical protein
LNAQHASADPAGPRRIAGRFTRLRGRGIVRLRAVLGNLETYESTLHADGSFEFRQVTPGTYT